MPLEKAAPYQSGTALLGLTFFGHAVEEITLS